MLLVTERNRPREGLTQGRKVVRELDLRPQSWVGEDDRAPKGTDGREGGEVAVARQVFVGRRVFPTVKDDLRWFERLL